MKEDDYLWASFKTRLNVAASILRGVIPGCLATKEERALLRQIHRDIENLTRLLRRRRPRPEDEK